MVSEQMKDGMALPTSSVVDTMKTSDTSMDDSVPVISQPEVMISTAPMITEAVVPSQIMTTDPLMTDAASDQMMTASINKDSEEQTMPKPEMTETEETSSRGWSETSATDVLKKIYDECVQHGSFACVKPKVLSFLSAAVKKDKILLTDDLVIEKTGRIMKDAYGYERPLQVLPFLYHGCQLRIMFKLVPASKFILTVYFSVFQQIIFLYGDNYITVLVNGVVQFVLYTKSSDLYTAIV
jgi:hypothetical protein